MPVAHDLIQYSLGIGAIEIIPEGRKLKNGRMSPYFFNAGMFYTGARLATLGQFFARKAMEEHIVPKVVFGPAYKGVPLSVSVAMAFYAHYGQEVGWSFNRKEAKGHGEGGIMVGSPLKGKDVIIVDDVITSGDTKSEAVSLVRQAGGRPTHCLIAFDRQESGLQGKLSAAQQFIKTERMPLISIATLADLITVLKKDKPEHREYRRALPQILAYQQRYGA